MPFASQTPERVRVHLELLPFGQNFVSLWVSPVSLCLPASVPGQGSSLEQLQTGNLRVALVTQASPCLILHRQTPTNSPTLFSAHCSGFTSPSAIGLPAPQSPHLPTRIGYGCSLSCMAKGKALWEAQSLSMTSPASSHCQELQVPNCLLLPPPHLRACFNVSIQSWIIHYRVLLAGCQVLKVQTRQQTVPSAVLIRKDKGIQTQLCRTSIQYIYIITLHHLTYSAFLTQIRPFWPKISHHNCNQCKCNLRQKEKSQRCVHKLSMFVCFFVNDNKGLKKADPSA